MDDYTGYKEGDDHELVLQKQEWVKTQAMLRSKLILEDDFDWNLPSVGSSSDSDHARGKLKYVGGTDISFLKEEPSTACATVLHHVDGLNQSEVRRQLEAKENRNKELISLTGQSGTTWGVAMRSCPGSSKPIYISVGHRISLDSAIAVVRLCCKYRAPEPTRQADIRSKVFLQKLHRTRQ